MKKTNGVLIGMLFILIGFLYACSALDLFHFSIFFPGLWTLFIIVPCLYGLVKKKKDRTGCIIGLVIGLCFLINAQDFSFHINFWPMIFALLCIAVGLRLIFPDKPKETSNNMEFDGNWEEPFHNKRFASETTYTKDGEGYLKISALFSGKDVHLDNEIFTGADVCVTFGGVDLDLRHAVICEDVYIRVNAMFGGFDLLLPANVRIVTDDCAAVFGGVEVNRAYANCQNLDAPRVIVSGSCIFGGIEIK